MGGGAGGLLGWSLGLLLDRDLGDGGLCEEDGVAGGGDAAAACGAVVLV